jgi:hypothetical protein
LRRAFNGQGGDARCDRFVKKKVLTETSFGPYAQGEQLLFVYRSK